MDRIESHVHPVLTSGCPIRVSGIFRLGICSAILVVIVGCSKHPARIHPVDIDAKSASANAIDQYDKNGDGLLDNDEMTAVPGILKYKDKYDTDGDGMVSREEIANRISRWKKLGLGVVSLNVVVRLAGRPLPGASVRFVPEVYLGAGPRIATGECNQIGETKVSVANSELPKVLQAARLGGIYGGTYKIEVTHPQVTIPEKYNTATTLGEEVARDTVRERLVLELKKK